MLSIIRSLNKFKLWQIFVIFLFGFSDSVLAQSIDSYCISRVKPEIEAIPKIPFAAYVFSLNGKEYLLEKIVGIGELHIKDRISGQLISKIPTSFREKDEWIRYIEIGKDNTVLMGTRMNNYVSKILEYPEIKLAKVSAYPKIYKQKCVGLRWFLGDCTASSFNYSPTLNRLFISGYREMSGKHRWGTIESKLGNSYDESETLPFSKSIKSFAGDSPSLNGVFFKGVDNDVIFYDGSKTTQLPKGIKEFVKNIPSLNGVMLQGEENEMFFYNGQTIVKLDRKIEYLVREVPSLRGILLMGSKAEVLFYDGNQITEISKDFVSNNKPESWEVIEPIVFNQPLSKVSEERLFIRNFGIQNNSQFLLELTDKLSTKPIPFPKNINISSPRLFRFPDDSLIWAKMGNHILVENNGNFQSVVTVPKWHTLYRSPYTTDVFQFEVRKGSGKQLKIATYYITKASPIASCEHMLNPNKTILLQPEF